MKERKVNRKNANRFFLNWSRVSNYVLIERLIEIFGLFLNNLNDWLTQKIFNNSWMHDIIMSQTDMGVSTLKSQLN